MRQRAGKTVTPGRNFKLTPARDRAHLDDPFSVSNEDPRRLAASVLCGHLAPAFQAHRGPRHAPMAKGRFFGGLNGNETAELPQVSEATILRAWRAAKAWLTHEIRQRQSALDGRRP